MDSQEDDRRAFAEERRRRLLGASIDDEVWLAAKDFTAKSAAAKYSYNFEWLGLPIIQFPQDLIAIQEILWRVRPDVVIETGVARGGSVVFYASVLKLIGRGGRVVGVDINIRPHNRRSIETHPLAEAIHLVEGSSIAPETLATVRRIAAKATTILVVLDSSHTHEHVLAELRAYSKLVGRGSYLIVLDTLIEELPRNAIGDRPWGRGNNPFTAVREFLKTNDRFAVDEMIDAKLMISAAPSGYLQCVKDSDDVRPSSL